MPPYLEQGCQKLAKGGVTIDWIIRGAQWSKGFLHEAQKNLGLF